MGAKIVFTQIASGDLDVTVIGQLPPSQLPLHSDLKPGSLEVERFETSCGRWRLIQ